MFLCFFIYFEFKRENRNKLYFTKGDVNIAGKKKRKPCPPLRNNTDFYKETMEYNFKY